MSETIKEEVVGCGALKYVLFSDIENGVTDYGVEITSTLFSDKPEIKSVPNITTDLDTAERLFELMVSNLVLPCTLKYIVEDYVAEIFSVKS